VRVTVGERVIGLRRVDQRGEILGRGIDAAAADLSQKIVLQAVLVTQVGVNPEPLEKVVGKVEGTGKVLLAAL